MNELQEKIERAFERSPEMIFGFTEIQYCDLGKDYKSALVFAVPYTNQLSVGNYNEKAFNDGILGAKEKLEIKVSEIENILKSEDIRYYIPEVAQKDDGRFRAEFSFKDAAASAGRGWFGKNDVIITEKYGPRIRLSSILIDCEFEYDKSYEKYMCPDDCNKCVDICPGHALLDVRWDVGMVRDDIIDISYCNRIRSAFYKSSDGGALVCCVWRFVRMETQNR